MKLFFLFILNCVFAKKVNKTKEPGSSFANISYFFSKKNVDAILIRKKIRLNNKKNVFDSLNNFGNLSFNLLSQNKRWEAEKSSDIFKEIKSFEEKDFTYSDFSIGEKFQFNADFHLNFSKMFNLFLGLSNKNNSSYYESIDVFEKKLADYLKLFVKKHALQESLVYLNEYSVFMNKHFNKIEFQNSLGSATDYQKEIAIIDKQDFSDD